jgi:hypothetical protein
MTALYFVLLSSGSVTALFNIPFEADVAEDCAKRDVFGGFRRGTAKKQGEQDLSKHGGVLMESMRGCDSPEQRWVGSIE